MKEALEHDVAIKAAMGDSDPEMTQRLSPDALKQLNQERAVAGLPPSTQAVRVAEPLDVAKVLRGVDEQQAVMTKALVLDMLAVVRFYNAKAVQPVAESGKKGEHPTTKPVDLATATACLSIAQKALDIAKQMDLLAEQAVGRLEPTLI